MIGSSRFYVLKFLIRILKGLGAVFTAICAAGIILSGYLFTLLQGVLL